MLEDYNIPILPLPFDIESKIVLRKAIQAAQQLAELKGVAHTIPNEAILINTLILQEAKDSSLKIKIELDLEVEVDLYARVQGDITIGLM